MTDQADTPDPIGARLTRETLPEALGLTPEQETERRDALAVALDRISQAERNTPSAERTVAALVAEVRALHAENERLVEQRDAMIWAAEQLQSERDAALAELAAARDREAAVRALHTPGKNIIVWSYSDDEGVTTRPAQQCNGCTRGDELRQWPCSTIAALSQSEPTKETP